MIWGAATPADAQLLKQIRNAGYKGPAAGDVAFSLPFIPKDAGPAADTIMTLSQLNTVNPTPQIRSSSTDSRPPTTRTRRTCRAPRMTPSTSWLRRSRRRAARPTR